METMSQFGNNGFETKDQKMGRLDALIVQVDMQIKSLENGKDRKKRQEEIRAFRYKKDELLKERAILTEPEEAEMKKAS